MELIESDFIEDIVDEDELKLVDKLKKLCGDDGKEMEGTHLNCAAIFYDLAKIYENKTKLQKLNIIRSAALYNAAIVRDPENQQFKVDLEVLCSAVLVKAKAVKLNANLISLAAEVKIKLNKDRKYFGESFNQLEIIPDVKGDQLIEVEKKRIKDVQRIQDEVTRRYTELMRFISGECIKIMGTPPCKYAVVGMGSLARSEITPYSDFEHIIVLENDVADQRMIMKYFRWFTTIFNIILINLGETMINCVAIPSINPRYRYWFMDHVTPNGITFDGMVAHACKLPLGRPKTKNKPWNTELIKPADQMVQYLDTEEDLKEGYHLADILSKTCFVAGEETVFLDYQRKSHSIAQKNDVKSDFSGLIKQTDDDLKNFGIVNQQFNAYEGFNTFNMKRVIYRSSTIFIAAIGRLYSLQESSCFDVIAKLKEIGGCSENMAHKLCFMVAVACEVRAKVYHSKRQQDDVLVDSSDKEQVISALMKLIGKEGLISFMGVVLHLHWYLIAARDDKKNLTNLNIVQNEQRESEIRFAVLILLDLTEDLSEIINNMISKTLQPCDADLCLRVIDLLFKRSEFKAGLDLCTKASPLLPPFKVKVNILQFMIELDQKIDEKQIEDLNKLREEVDIPPNEYWQHSFVLFKYGHCLKYLKHNPNYVFEKSLEYWRKYDQTASGKSESKFFKASTLVRYAGCLDTHQHLYIEALLNLQGSKPTTDLHRIVYLNSSITYFKLNKLYGSFILLYQATRIGRMNGFPPIPAIHQQMRILYRILCSTQTASLN